MASQPYDPAREFRYAEGCGCVMRWAAPHRFNCFRFVPCHVHDPKWTEARGWALKVQGRGWKALEQAREEAE